MSPSNACIAEAIDILRSNDTAQKLDNEFKKLEESYDNFIKEQVEAKKDIELRIIR